MQSNFQSLDEAKISVKSNLTFYRQGGAWCAMHLGPALKPTSCFCTALYFFHSCLANNCNAYLDPNLYIITTNVNIIPLPVFARVDKLIRI